MPYWRLFYHIVWTVKNREPLLDPAWRGRLYAALSEKARAMGAIVHAIGGVEDHVHMVVSIPPTLRISDLVGQVKGSSSHLVSRELAPDSWFAWQGSYGVVSFDEQALGRIVRYVPEQDSHHREATTVARLEVTDDAASG